MIARAYKTDRTDAELMELMAREEMEPLGELYLRYGGPVRSLLWRLLPEGTHAEADDLCQEVFMTAYECAARFQTTRELRPWLFGIAVRKARGWSRKGWVRENLLRQHRKTVAQNLRSSVTQGAAPTTRHEINHALARLPQTQLEVLVLYVAHNQSGEEIAASLGIRLNTVWTRLRRARLAMKKALQSDRVVKSSGEEI